MISNVKRFDKPNIYRLNHLELLESFNIPKNELVICGSGILVVDGYIEKNEDLDCVVSNDIYQKLKKEPRLKYDKIKNTYQTPNGEIEFLDRFNSLNLSFNELKKDAIKRDGYLFMSYAKLLQLYQKLNRPKDQTKIKLIKKILGMQ